MVKHFCDVCEAEITDENKPSGGIQSDSNLGVIVYRKNDWSKANEITIEVTVKSRGDTDVCKHCIIDSISRLDYRPKLAMKD